MVTEYSKPDILDGRTDHFIWGVDDVDSAGRIYIDTCIDQAFSDVYYGKKYAWIKESPIIVPNIYTSAKIDTARWLETFDCIFTCSRELLSLHDKFKWIVGGDVWINEPSVCDKSKMVSMICSNKHPWRHKWVDKFRSQLDFYGNGWGGNSI